MTGADFVKRIHSSVYAHTIEDLISILRNPPGRKPSPDLVELSNWFNELSAHEHKRIRQVIELSVRDTVFAMLSILDNVSSISEPGEQVTIELRCNDDGHSLLLNDPEEEMLHDIFASVVLTS